jgi:hypothetical protein
MRKEACLEYDVVTRCSPLAITLKRIISCKQEDATTCTTGGFFNLLDDRAALNEIWLRPPNYVEPSATVSPSVAQR